jgi:hypothetical protein
MQGERERVVAAQAGFELRTEPEGVELGTAEQELAGAAETLAARLAECSAAGDAALVGGYTALWITALDLLARRNIKRPQLCYFSTLRKRDVHGRFVFEPLGVERIPVADSPPGNGAKGPEPK